MTELPEWQTHEAEPSLYTIVMPTFNAASTVRRAVDSVHAQGCGRWRLIVVDDGSEDGTAGIVRACSTEDDRVSLLVQDHRGPAEARNAGVAASHTTYVVFLDADDELEPDYLSAMDEFVTAHPGFDVYHPNLTVVRGDAGRSLFSTRAQAGSTTFEDLLQECVIAVGGAVVNRDLFLRIGGFRSGIHCEDYDFWLRAIAQGARALYTPSPLYVYHQDVGDRRSEDALAGAEDLVVSLTSLVDEGLVQPQLRGAVGEAISRRRQHVITVAREEELAQQAERLKTALDRQFGSRASRVILAVAHKFTWLTRPLRGMIAGRRKRRSLTSKADSLRGTHAASEDDDR